ncbi:MAG: amino acid permease [Proteobacteria bacterium]|nr:amino acid permease [Pseudomonadota bacterium]
MSLLQQLTRHKSVEALQAEAGARRDFRRVLGVWQLTAIGIGGIIGVGIFVLAGQQAAANAGPAVAVSFLIAGIGSACAALCYAEFAGMIPVTGSAYTYGYAVLGARVAWLVGWALLPECALVVAVVAIGWAGYVQVLLSSAGIHLPAWAQGALGTGEGHVFNVIAAAISLVVAGLLTVRTEWGARFNTVIVAIKVIGALLVIGIGAFLVDPANWHPFVPARAMGTDGMMHFGWSGVLTAASVVFFACFGYDTLTTAAEEARNPQRDLPRAVIASLAISMTLYIVISFVLTGMVPYAQLGGAAPVSDAFAARGFGWIGVAVAAVVVVGVMSVLFAFMLGTARIWFALARDGLLPGWFARVHPKYGTPYRPTLIAGAFTALVAGLLPITEVAELINIGTLSAFIIICASILVLRKRQPDLQRSFRTPAAWIVAPLGILFSIALIWGLPVVTWERFVIWMLVGFVIYFGYGIRRSALARGGGLG